MDTKTQTKARRGGGEGNQSVDSGNQRWNGAGSSTRAEQPRGRCRHPHGRGRKAGSPSAGAACFLKTFYSNFIKEILIVASKENMHCGSAT